MADKLTPERRSANMARIRSRDMKPELVVRRLAHSLGARFRLHRKDLPGRPDLAFIGKRKAIFVHGCFWHQHDLQTCLDGRRPKSNLHYWGPKLDKNIARDTKAKSDLEALGWQILIIWECEVRDAEKLKSTLRTFLETETE